jgi:hypothetical protein
MLQVMPRCPGRSAGQVSGTRDRPASAAASPAQMSLCADVVVAQRSRSLSRTAEPRAAAQRSSVCRAVGCGHLLNLHPAAAPARGARSPPRGNQLIASARPFAFPLRPSWSRRLHAVFLPLWWVFVGCSVVCAPCFVDFPEVFWRVGVFVRQAVIQIRVESPTHSLVLQAVKPVHVARSDMNISLGNAFRDLRRDAPSKAMQRS